VTLLDGDTNRPIASENGFDLWVDGIIFLSDIFVLCVLLG